MADPIKEAFQKVKDDIQQLRTELEEILNELHLVKRTLNQTDKPTNQQTNEEIIQTQGQFSQTDKKIISNNLPLQSLKTQNSDVSIGNRGVPTDRQTNQQTDRQDDKFAQSNMPPDRITHMDQVAEVLNSLDALKKDIRKQFKQLTPQEMLIFSTIYQLTDQGIDVDYTLLAQKTNLSESSMRDYILKLTKKGVPLQKVRENNKRVTLSIPSEFKRLASLDTILALRSI